MDTKQIYGYHANNGTDAKIWVSDRTVFIYIMEFGYGSMPNRCDYSFFCVGIVLRREECKEVSPPCLFTFL